jgi:hypothetical protein
VFRTIHNQNRIEGKLKGIIILKYKKVDMKLTKLTKEQITTPQRHDLFNPRVINNKIINFSEKKLGCITQ